MIHLCVLGIRAGHRNSGRSPCLLAPLLLSVALVGVALAAPTGVVAQNARLRADSATAAFQAGRLSEAARILQSLTTEFPADGGLAWLYAQVLAEAGAASQADQYYQRAVDLLPDDPWLRLEFGRFLVERGQRAKGIAVLDPVRGLQALPTAASEAESLTGMAEYWDGDLVAAAGHLEHAVDLDPERTEAKALLREVRAALAATITTASRVSDDDQPLQTLGQVLAIAAPLGGRTRGRVIGSAHLRSGTDLRESTLSMTAGIATALPGGRLTIDVAGGFVRRGAGLAGMATGTAGVSVGIGPETFLRIDAGRAPYFWTVASLDTALAVSSLELRLDRAASTAWAGEGLVRLERFPDGNVIKTLSAWLLAPVYVHRSGSFRVGYAGTTRDSRTSTFRTRTNTPPAGPPGEALSGIYDPYFTPESERTHSLIMEGRGGSTTATFVHVTAVYGISARESAPMIARDQAGQPLPPAFGDRNYTPWSVRGGLASPPLGRTRLSLTAEHRRTAFYSLTQVEVGLEYRLGLGGSARP